MYVVLFSGYTDTKTRVSALVNTALAVASPEKKVVIASLSENSFDLDLLVFEEDEEAVREFRSQVGVADLIAEYRQVLMTAAVPAAPVEVDSEDSVSYGTIHLRKPSKYVVPKSYKNENPRLLLLRGGPRKFSEAEPLTGNEPPNDLVDLWSNWAGAAFFDHLVLDLSASAAFLFIDCDLVTQRESALLIAAQADLVVSLCDYTEGTLSDAFHFAQALRSRLGSDTGPCLVTVPSAVHINEEIEILEKLRNHFEKYVSSRFGPSWLAPYWFVQAELPYVPYYIHRNLILLKQDVARIHVPLYQAYDFLASKISECANRADSIKRKSVQDPRDRFLDARRRVHWDVFISHSSHDVAMATILRKSLRDHQLRSFLSSNDLMFEVGSAKWLEAINNVLARSTVLIIVVTAEASESKWVRHEFEEFIRNARLVIPVALSGATLPPYLTEYQMVAWDGQADSEEQLRNIVTLVFGAMRMSTKGGAIST